ncbi:MAG: helix-turn-helix transcriptional regulator [Chloroflexi bacterium]|nr:MAG: helix-turn-helix transcriptional regulator [Chloroflexota bacterium]
MVDPMNRADRARLREIFDPLRVGRAMARHGVRPAILAVLAKAPMHGYQVMQELEQLSGGRWRPSAGSVYPILQQLEDEGMVRSREQDGRRVYTLTVAGAAEAERSPLRRHPWFDARGGKRSMDLRRLAVQLVGGAIQVSRVGSEEAQAQAREILIDARRRIYGLLADDDGEPLQAASRDKEAVQ